MVESIHVKLESFEARDNKRNILLLQEAFLRSARHIKAYKLLKARENSLKNIIQKNLSFIRNAIIILENHLPKEDVKITDNHIQTIKRIIKNDAVKQNVQKSDRSSLDEELELIRQKLASLR